MPRELPEIITFVVLIAIAFFLGKMITDATFVPLAIGAGLLVALLTFQNPSNGLILIVFSMLLSPEIKIADIPGRPVVMRLDDILIVVMFLAWLARRASMKDTKGFEKTPLDVPLIALISVYLISTCLSIVIGKLNPMRSFFYLLRYVEYFILYWLTANIVADKKEIPRYLTAGFLTLAAVTIFAYSLFNSAPRVYAPFDTEATGVRAIASVKAGEPASLGGYYLIIFAVLFSFFMYGKTQLVRMGSLATALLMLPPFVKTLSRASYLAFIPLLLSLLILTKKRRNTFAALLLAGALIFPFFFRGLYQNMMERVMQTFTVSGYLGTYNVGGKRITDPSAMERIISWQKVVQEKILKNPLTVLFGTGITGLGFVEGQFFLVLGELGIAGVATFYLMFFLIIKHSYRIHLQSVETIPQSLSLALMVSSVALLFQSLTTNTFIIVRIMEPFWFLAGLVMTLPKLYEIQASRIS